MTQQPAHSTQSAQQYVPSRRAFLGSVGLLAAGGLTSSSFAATPWQEETAGSLVKGKDDRLLVLKKHPAVFETPLKLLAEQNQTPSSLLFVRNNQQPEDAATLAPASKDDWSVKLIGSINRELTVSLQRLREMEQTEYEMVLQCSGNGRALFSKAAQTSGTQWGRGGFGNVKFSGVRLSTVLEKNGIEIDKTVRYVNASGADEALPGKEDFMHSLPIHDVLNRSIIALDLNGKPLPAIHGGPVRLITPGVFATMNMKWLNELNFVGEESSNYNHLPRYRVPRSKIAPGSEYEFTFENSRFNWNMKVKSIILTPNDGDVIKAGATNVKGVAFNDGRTRIEAVYLSFNQGESWEKADIQPADSLYAWTPFSLRKQFDAGQHHIWCRAIDAYGRTQPNDGSIAWNPRGYEWNGIEKLTVNVS